MYQRNLTFFLLTLIVMIIMCGKLSQTISPVVVIEYNSIFRPGVEFVVDYEPQVMWDKTSHFGGSLESYCNLGKKKGYLLVGCSFSGSNAFFVQSNLAEKYFHGPFSAANFYEPPRYFLLSKNGHPRKLKL